MREDVLVKAAPFLKIKGYNWCYKKINEWKIEKGIIAVPLILERKKMHSV